MNIVLVELGGVLSDLLEAVMSHGSEIRVVRDTPIGAADRAASGEVDAIIGGWSKAAAADAFAAEMLALDSGLVLVLVSDPPARFRLRTARGVETLPDDISPEQLRTAIRERIDWRAKS